jgi:nitroreductase
MAESRAMAGFEGETVKRALAIARFAPSAHNTQPWRVSREGDRLVIGVDPRRHLAHSDPLARDLHLALGGFVEAITLALAAEGVAAAAVDPPAGAFAALEHAGSRGRDAGPISLLRRRQTSRLAYSPRPLEAAAVDALAAAARAHGISLHAAARGTAERAKLDAWFFAATRESWLDARAVAELRAWMRLDPEGARAPEDGLSTHCLGLGTADGIGASLAVRAWPWRAAGAVFLAPLLAERLAASEARDVAEAPFLGLLVADRAGAAAAGAGLLRVWLAATELGLAIHPISVLIDRRGWEVARHLGVPADRVMFAFRLGRSAPPPRSGRLPVERFARV